MFNSHLIRALLELGYDLSVVSVNDREGSDNPGYVFVPCGKHRYFKKIAFAVNSFRQMLAFKPEFVLCGHVNMSFFCMLLSRVFKIPYFTVAHGVEAWQLKGIRKLGVRCSKGIFSVSRFTRSKILSRLPAYPRSAIPILHNTFDEEQFNLRMKPVHLMQRWGIAADDRIILTVARLSARERYKGYDRLIMAMREIVKEIPNAKYIIVGSGSDDNRIRRLIRDNHLQERVILTGFIPHEEMADYYGLCDVFAMPSKGEGFGIVFLEALACGKPVIAGNKDGSTEVFLSTSPGILVDPDNHIEIKEAVVKILKQEIPPELSNGAELRRYARDNFGFNAFKEQLSGIIHKNVIAVPAAPVRTFVIKPVKGWVAIDFRELWHYRELLYFLVWREIKVRYKQTVLGASWAILQPLLMMIVFSLFFGKFMKVPRQGISYPLFSYAAILPWMLFSEGVNRSASSLIQSASLINKIYFPRIIMPVSGILTPVVDFCYAFLVFVGLMFYYGFAPTIKILLLPVFVVLALGTALSVGIWLAAVNVKYRDLRYVIPFLIQFWFFASPVAYSSSSLPEHWQLIYSLNPMVGVIEGFRWILLGAESPTPLMLVSLSIVLLLMISGAFYFRRMEKDFADVI